MPPKVTKLKNERSIRWAVSLLFIGLVLFESYLLDVAYSQYLVDLFDSQGIFLSFPMLLGVAIPLFLFYLFLHVSLTASWFYKTISALFFLIVCLFEYSYVRGLGRFTRLSDVEIAFVTSPEQKLESLYLYLSYWALLPFGVFVFMLILVKHSGSPTKPKHLAATLFLYASLFTGLSYFKDNLLGEQFLDASISARKQFPAPVIGAFCRTTADFLLHGPIANGKWGSSFTGIKLERKPVEKPSFEFDFSPQNNVVLIIDESVRGDHLSLNGYNRKTTPVLDELEKKGVLHNWGIAVAGSTGSTFSYNALITGLTPNDFPEKMGFKVNTYATIYQYAKAMNYKTYLFDGQLNQIWVGIPEDQKWIDKFEGVDKFNDYGHSPSWEIDNKIAVEVNRIISESSGNFIVILKRGSHIAYQNNFPDDQTKWKPSYESTDMYAVPPKSDLYKVTNAYDNSIRYNVNSFFRNLVTDYLNIPNNSVILYTGDHGQTLFAGGRTSHGGKTKAEANVPMFIIGKLDKETDTQYKASHQNIFPTLLDLIEYPEKLRRKNISISLLKAKKSDSKPRFFNPDLDKRVPFDQ